MPENIIWAYIDLPDYRKGPPGGRALVAFPGVQTRHPPGAYTAEEGGLTPILVGERVQLHIEDIRTTFCFYKSFNE